MAPWRTDGSLTKRAAGIGGWSPLSTKDCLDESAETEGAGCFSIKIENGSDWSTNFAIIVRASYRRLSKFSRG